MMKQHKLKQNLGEDYVSYKTNGSDYPSGTFNPY